MELLTAKEAREIADKVKPNEFLQAYLNMIKIAAQDGNHEICEPYLSKMNAVIKNKLIDLGFTVTTDNRLSEFNVIKIEW